MTSFEPGTHEIRSPRPQPDITAVWALQAKGFCASFSLRCFRTISRMLWMRLRSVVFILCLISDAVCASTCRVQGSKRAQSRHLDAV